MKQDITSIARLSPKMESESIPKTGKHSDFGDLTNPIHF